MKRALPLAVLLLAGCASNGTPGSSDFCTPPTPRIQASRTDEGIRVEYEIPEGACEPWGIHVTAHSVDKLDNIAPRPGTGGVLELSSDHGIVELKPAPLDLPPYEALASTTTSRGRRSATTKVRIPESGDYCRRSQSAAVCIARARAKFMRCLRGKAPRDECPDYVWNARPLIPYEPIEGVTRVSLERSFASIADNLSAEFVSARCSSMRWCTGTWRAYWGILRARYQVSGYGSRAGCWNAERRAILKEDKPPEHMAPLRHIVSDRFSGCA